VQWMYTYMHVCMHYIVLLQSNIANNCITLHHNNFNYQNALFSVLPSPTHKHIHTHKIHTMHKGAQAHVECIHTHVRTQIHPHIYIHMHAHTQHAHTHTHTLHTNYAFTYVYTNTHSHIHAYTKIYVTSAYYLSYMIINICRKISMPKYVRVV